MKLPIPVPSKFRIIAHRGASAYAPENTMAAFQLAQKMQRTEFELDVQMSVDGKLVICHDLTLERYGHGNLVVESIHSEDLLKMDMGSWFSPYLFKGEKMISFHSLLEQFRSNAFFHVELKGKAKEIPGLVCRSLKDFQLLDKAIITSFNLEMLKAVAEIDSAFKRGWLVESITPEILDLAQQHQLFQICPKADSVSRESVWSTRGKVAEVRTWGIDGPRSQAIKLINRVIESGCDGTTINWPDWLFQTA